MKTREEMREAAKNEIKIRSRLATSMCIHVSLAFVLFGTSCQIKAAAGGIEEGAREACRRGQEELDRWLGWLAAIKMASGPARTLKSCSEIDVEKSAATAGALPPHLSQDKQILIKKREKRKGEQSRGKTTNHISCGNINFLLWHGNLLVSVSHAVWQLQPLWSCMQRIFRCVSFNCQSVNKSPSTWSVMHSISGRTLRPGQQAQFTPCDM